MAFGQIAAARKVLDHFAVAHGLPGRLAQRPGSFQQPADLVDQSRGEHLLQRGDRSVRASSALGQSSTKTRHSAAGRPTSNCRCNSLIGRPVFSINLDRPNEPPGVVRMQSGGRRRIDLGQHAREAIAPPCCRALSAKPMPQLPIGRRPLEDAPQQSFQIKRRSADEQHLPSAAGDFRRATARPPRHTAPG